MKHGWLAGLMVSILGVCTLVNLSAADPGVTFVGLGLVPGNALDKSGLAGQAICQADNVANCIDRATFGGWGSGLVYTGHDNVFVAQPDRGPFDGRTDVPYLDRFHFLHITLDATATSFPNIKTVLLDTRFLEDEKKESLVGDAYAFNAVNHQLGKRFDPEGIAIGPNGRLYVSDEYGPRILGFDKHGKLHERIAVPSRFLLALSPAGNPSGDVDASGNSLELYQAFNVFGRQANRGMEGLTITPDGRTLVGIMQNALLQDNALLAGTITRTGVYNRILTVDLQTGATHEYVYVMDSVVQGRGVNDMLAINDHEFLVLERDNRTRVPIPGGASQTPVLKRIYKVDLNKPNLTDVSNIDSLPSGALGSIVPVTKTLFIDLLDPSYKVNATQTILDIVPEKVEGLAWGPDLPDGRHLLYVVSDNDLFPGLPTQIYAFAIDGSLAGVRYQPQQGLQPLFPPGQVKKILEAN